MSLLEPRLHSISPRGPLWLSHHRTHQHERCVKVSGISVCRRCAVMYPIIVVSALASLCFGVINGPIAAVVVSMLVVPFVIEWVTEQSGAVRYSPARQGVVSAIAAVGGGLALAVHVSHRFDLWVTVPIGLAAVAALVSSLWSHRRARSEQEGHADWVNIFRTQEAERSARLQMLLDDHALATRRRAS